MIILNVLFGYGVLYGALIGVVLRMVFLYLQFVGYSRLLAARIISYADQRAMHRMEGLRRDLHADPIATLVTILRWPTMFCSFAGFVIENIMRLF